MAIWDKLHKHAFDDFKKQLNISSAVAFCTIFQFPRHDAIFVAQRWKEAQSTLFQEAADINDQPISFDGAFLVNIRSSKNFSEALKNFGKCQKTKIRLPLLCQILPQEFKYMTGKLLVRSKCFWHLLICACPKR